MSEESGYDDSSNDIDDDESSAQDYDDDYADDDDDNVEKTYTQSQVEKMIRSRFPEYDELRSKAEQFDGLFEASQGAEDEVSTWRTKAEEYEAELSWRDTLLLRQQVAASKGLDPNLWDRVKGETQDEIETDVGSLLGAFGASRPRSASALRSGASTDSPTDRKERAAQAFRQARDAR